MPSFIACHKSGVTFDYDSVPRTPFRFVPGSSIPLDRECVDFYFPEPSPSDPNAASKSVARSEALANAEVYAAAADAARK